MSPANPEPRSGGNGCSIKVGATGTIASLMSRELGNVQQAKPAFDHPPLKYQSAPVSVPCGATPRRLQFRRFPSSDAGSSSNRGGTGVISDGVKGRIGVGKAQESQKHRQRQGGTGDGCGSRLPMLTTPDRGHRAAIVQEMAKRRKDRRDKSAAQHSLVEVVDLKCNNPMSGRLKKLGFSKLSETIA